MVSNDPRLKLFQRNRLPKGGSTCRNIGIENARGDYLFFFDSDDLMTKDCIGERVNLMQDNTTLDFAVFPVGTFYKAIGDSTMVWRTKKGDHLKQFLRHDLPWNIMSPIWRTPFVKNKLNGFDESFPRLQDVEFHTRALLQKGLEYKIVNNTSPKCFYRIDHERTKQSTCQYLEGMLSGVEKYLNKFEALLSDVNQIRYLRSTLFTIITLINFKLTHNQISLKEYTVLNNRISKFVKKGRLFSNFSVKILTHYDSLYKKGFWRIKGFNYLFKQLWEKV